MGIKARAIASGLMTIKLEWSDLTHLAHSVQEIIKLFWTVGPFSILLIWSSGLGWPLQGSFNLAINEAENNTSLISNQPAHILILQFGCSYRPDNISLTKLLFNISDDYQDKLKQKYQHSREKTIQGLPMPMHKTHVSTQKSPFHSLVIFIGGNWPVSLIIS